MDLKRHSKGFSIRENTEIGYVRRHATQWAHDLGFNETLKGRVALVVTEMGTNLIRHAGKGELIISAVRSGDITGLEILSLDKGRGLGDLSRCMGDGFSTGGSPGTGLGAIRRQSDFFDVFSRPHRGTALLATIWSSEGTKEKESLVVGGVCVAVSGEMVSGDSWGIVPFSPYVTEILVADGLGHGVNAAEASLEAVRTFESTKGLSPARTLEQIHGVLRKTRGAAVALSEIDVRLGKLNFSGVGNISATLYGPHGRKGIASSNGIVGHNVPRVTDFLFPWSAESLLVMHSDGLSNKWDLADPNYLNLSKCHPSLIAGVLYRDFRRERDDSTVVVIKQKQDPGANDEPRPQF